MKKHVLLTTQKGAGRIIALSMMVLILAALLSGCGDRPDSRDSKNATATPSGADKTATPTGGVPATPDPTDAPIPSDTPTPEPTETPTPAATDTPTPEPTSTPTPTVPFGIVKSDYKGFWYSKTISGLEMEETDCTTDPNLDYHLEFTYWDDDELSATLTHMVPYYDKYYDLYKTGVSTHFSLVTSTKDLDMEMYRSWNYGVVDYFDNMTDLSKGHLIFERSWTDDDAMPDGALLIVDAQPDGTLKSELIYVLDNGSFPVFVTTKWTKPAVAMGADYNDYLGTWFMHSAAGYYGEAETYTSGTPTNYLTFERDGSLIFTEYGWDMETEDYVTYYSRYRLRTEFSAAEQETYRSWDKAGVYAEGRVIEGIALETVMYGTDFSSKRMVFSADNGNLLEITWSDDDGQTLCVYDIYRRELDEDDVQWINDYCTDDFTRSNVAWIESVMYYTFKRDYNSTKPAGSYFEDFVGTWNMTEYHDDPEGNTIIVADPAKLARLVISPDGTVTEIKDEKTESTYVIRTASAADDPAWYKDLSLQKIVTNYEYQQLVLLCTDDNENRNAMLVLHFNGENTVQASFYYRKNDQACSQSRTYAKETGVLRRE